MNNNEQEGKSIETNTYKVLNEINKEIIFPTNTNSIIFFWASWCMPCKVEMERLKTSVNNKKINSNQIIAINPFETNEQTHRFLKKNAYPFIFIDAKNISKDLGINATPTIALIKDNKVEQISSGISLWGIWKIESFLNEVIK